MFDTNILEWIGYASSILVLISLLMSSIIKLRWINLAGSTLFSIYGFSIGALPVGLVNLCIAFINIYYLYKIYSRKDSFKMLKVKGDNPYLENFLDYYQEDIKRYFPGLDLDRQNISLAFFVLRNVIPAGLFLASTYDDKSLFINLDFVMPEYRDFKMGQFVFYKQRQYFLDLGYQRFITFGYSDFHKKYLKRMGFEESIVDGRAMLVKEI